MFYQDHVILLLNLFIYFSQLCAWTIFDIVEKMWCLFYDLIWRQMEVYLYSTLFVYCLPAILYVLRPEDLQLEKKIFLYNSVKKSEGSYWQFEHVIYNLHSV